MKFANDVVGAVINELQILANSDKYVDSKEFINCHKYRYLFILQSLCTCTGVAAIT